GLKKTVRPLAWSLAFRHNAPTAGAGLGGPLGILETKLKAAASILAKPPSISSIANSHERNTSLSEAVIHDVNNSKNMSPLTSLPSEKNAAIKHPCSRRRQSALTSVTFHVS